MTVVLDKDDFDYPDWPQRPQCSVCDEKLAFPFVSWRVRGDGDVGHLCVCSRCCYWIRHGLTIDMDRCTAIKEAIETPRDYARPLT
jgi:hypothetical protein